MSDFLNPLGGRFIGPSGPVATSSVLGTVPDPPRAISLLDPGTIIKGVVLGRESDGLTAIATDKGTVRVASNMPLPAGTQVTLEVRPAGDRLQVLILANDAAQRSASTTTPVAAGAAGTTAPQAAAQPNTTPAAHGAQSANTAQANTAQATAPNPDAPRTDARGQIANASAATPIRTEQPAIQFVGSTLRAVVVQASPLPAPPQQTAGATPPTQQPPAQVQPPLPAAVQTPQPLPPQPAPLPPLQTQPPQQSPVPQVPGQVPPQPAPTATIPPVPTPNTPLPAGTIPVTVLPPAPLPTTPILPAPVPTAPALPTAPVPTAPVTTTPVPATPAPALPQGIPIPANIIMPAPSTAAALQAALLVAGAEKKPSGGQPATTAPVTTLYGPTAVAPILAAQEYAGHDAALNHPPRQGMPETAGGTGQIPAATAFGDDAKQRILALFASTGVRSGETEPVLVGANPGKINAAPLPLGAELKLRVLAVQMQAHLPVEFDPIAADPRDAHGQVIFGRVVSITPAGHAVIHTPLGDIMMQERSSLTVGARVALAIDTMEAAPPSVATALPMVQTPQQALLSLAQSWPTLADLIAVFQGSAGGAAKGDDLDLDMARQALALLPHAGVKLGAGMMNAMAALRSGDIGKLLGPLFAAKGAGAEREEMVRRLRGEFSQLTALAQDRPEVDWRALFLPVIDDQGRVGQINLFYRRPKKGDADDRAGGGTGTRFVVEADFSRLGPFQLDGLMRKQRFDLMIRSRTRLADRMRLDIEAIYEEARGLTGFAGSIAFQTVDEFPVIPLDDLKRGTPTVTV